MKIERHEGSSMTVLHLSIEGVRGDVATLYIEKETILTRDAKRTPRTTINWSAIGSADIDVAEKFAQGLLELVRIAREGVVHENV